VTPNRIVVPAPGLVVLVGAAGSGKSTLAGRLFAASDILSSDALRAAVGGDATDQRATRPAFRILHAEVQRRLAAGRLVVVDATSVERAARAALLRIAARAEVPATAIVLLVPAGEVHARNAARTGRIVPAAIVDRHLEALARLGANGTAIAAALTTEGFSRVHVLVGPDQRGPDGPVGDSPSGAPVSRR